MITASSDPQELAKFEALSTHWWDRTGALRTLHDINPARLAFILQHAVVEDQTVLDVGCGGGILSESLAGEGAKVTAIDLEASAIRVARDHAIQAQLDIDYQLADVVELAEQQAGQYDVITCMEMLEHVPQPKVIIRACVDLLKPGGTLFLSTINRSLKAYTHAILGAEYLLGLVPKHTHDHKKFIRPNELATELRRSDCRLGDIQGIHYNPLTKQARLTDSLEINYLLSAKKN